LPSIQTVTSRPWATRTTMKPLHTSPSLPQTGHSSHDDVRSEDRLNMLSHELRTPLAIISGYSEMLEEEAGRELGHLTRPIRDAIGRMQHVVDSLLEYEEARTIATPQAVAAQPSHGVEGSRIPLDHLIGRTIQKVQRRHGDTTVSVMVQVDNSISLPTDVGDALAGALNHVLDNAFKFARHSIRVMTSERAGMLSIQVRDDGEGLPSRSVAVFAPFQQGTNGLSREQSGLGMGLFLAKRSLGQVSGTIKLSSNGEETGTTATLSVPVAARGSMRRAA